MQPLPLPFRPPLRIALLLLAGLALAAAAPVQAGPEACIAHDSYHPSPVPVAAGPDGDGDLAAWVAAGPDASDGSTKVDTGCLTPP
jgi:hypothetical protein